MSPRILIRTPTPTWIGTRVPQIPTRSPMPSPQIPMRSLSTVPPTELVKVRPPRTVACTCPWGCRPTWGQFIRDRPVETLVATMVISLAGGYIWLMTLIFVFFFG